MNYVNFKNDFNNLKDLSKCCTFLRVNNQLNKIYN